MVPDSSSECLANVGAVDALLCKSAGWHVDVIVLDNNRFVPLDGIAMKDVFEIGDDQADGTKIVSSAV